MLNHLPDSWKQWLHAFYQKCWLNETLPSIWKQSVIIPILKQGKPKSAIASYRLMALTSHAGKIMGKILLKQLLHYCEEKRKRKKEKREDIIPAIQAGFRKGRCTIDHLVKLTNHIKKQFSRRKSTLATIFFFFFFFFFNVKRAYDSMWHARLLYKLKNIGITGVMFQYFKTFYPKAVFVLE